MIGKTLALFISVSIVVSHKRYLPEIGNNQKHYLPYLHLKKYLPSIETARRTNTFKIKFPIIIQENLQNYQNNAVKHIYSLHPNDTTQILNSGYKSNNVTTAKTVSNIPSQEYTSGKITENNPKSYLDVTTKKEILVKFTKTNNHHKRKTPNKNSDKETVLVINSATIKDLIDSTLKNRMNTSKKIEIIIAIASKEQPNYVRDPKEDEYVIDGKETQVTRINIGLEDLLKESMRKQLNKQMPGVSNLKNQDDVMNSPKENRPELKLDDFYYDNELQHSADTESNIRIKLNIRNQKKQAEPYVNTTSPTSTTTNMMKTKSTIRFKNITIRLNYLETQKRNYSDRGSYILPILYPYPYPYPVPERMVSSNFYY